MQDPTVNLGDDEKRSARFALSQIWAEYERARAKHPPMSGPHAGWAILFEEVDELWDEVKAHVQNKQRMGDEAMQVGAMALAFMVEVCGAGQ